MDRYNRSEDLARILSAECDRLIKEHQQREEKRRTGTLAQRTTQRNVQPDTDPPVDAAATERDGIAAELVRRLALRDQGR
jgi:uncharacterized alpha-E superfamily protein